MKIERRDILTPANAATLIGLIMTIHGSAHLDTLQGVAEIGAGRALDLIDGPLARRFYASRFGAALDGTADKVGTIAIIIGAYHYQAVPDILLGAVLLQNVINAGITLYAEHAGQHPESSFAGKRGMFFQNLAMVVFAFSHLVTSSSARYGLRLTGGVMAVIGFILGAIGTYGYFRDATGKKD
jgi:phosphatidylglycerophosphate synthase